MLLYLFGSSFSSYFIFSIIITVTYISIPTGIVNLFIGILVIAINDKYVKPIIPKESKIARAEAISTYVESGNVYIPEQASYMNDLEFEIVNFPAVEHDDQIDIFGLLLIV